MNVCPVLAITHKSSIVMFAFLRPAMPARLNRASSNPIIYEDGASSLEFSPEGTDFMLRNVHPPFDAASPSIMVPPFHYHTWQTEHFHIRSGECHLFKGNPKVPWKTLSAKIPDAPKTASIPKRESHTINNASTTEPLVLDVHLTPEDYQSEERFFRNFFGYLEDCRRAKQAPSLFQLMVFLRSADTPLGLPAPTPWLSFVLSRLFMNVAGLWGRWILGYRETYEEYYLNPKTL